MSLLSLLGWKAPPCCEEAWSELRVTRAREVAVRAAFAEERREAFYTKVADEREMVRLRADLERARDVAGTFLGSDGIDHGEPT